MPVHSQRIYSWAFETNLSGPISPEALSEAAMQFRQGAGSGVRVWLLDVGSVTFDISMLGAVSQAISEAVSNLRAMGLDRIAVVLPPIARPFVGAIDVKPITVHPFNSRAEAVEWLRRGCK